MPNPRLYIVRGLSSNKDDLDLAAYQDKDEKALLHSFSKYFEKKLTFSIGRFVCLPTLLPISYISIICTSTTLQKKVALFQYNENDS